MQSAITVWIPYKFLQHNGSGQPEPSMTPALDYVALFLSNIGDSHPVWIGLFFKTLIDE
jgi:hypothetical protein